MSNTKRILLSTDDANFIKFAMNEKKRMRLPNPEFKPVKGDKGDKGDEGIQGIQGKPGERGERGKHGKTGQTGIAGVTGKDGSNGTDGSIGVDGSSGIDGRGIRKAFIEKGKLILEFDDGTEQDVGKVVSKGSQAQGAGWGMKLDGSALDRHLTVLAGTTGSWKKTTGIIVSEDDTLNTPSGRVRNLTLVTESYTVLPTDDRIEFTITSPALVTLPDPTGNTGQEFRIINHYSSTANLTFSESLSGDIGFNLTACESVDIYSNGTEYMVD